MEEVTVLELICASPCITSMICFTLEAKYRAERPFDSKVHMSRHRMGARGNATTFPIPWQDIMTSLDDRPSLPRTGEELADVVSVILKTSDEDSPEGMARFIHQALVRRHVVIRLIEGAKRRGHIGYAHVDLEAVRRKAEQLPENGVPGEVLRMVAHDSDLDRVQVQKAATPVEARASVEDAGRAIARAVPNAVVEERSSYVDADVNAQRVAAVRHIAESLRPLSQRPWVEQPRAGDPAGGGGSAHTHTLTRNRAQVPLAFPRCNTRRTDKHPMQGVLLAFPQCRVRV